MSHALFPHEPCESGCFTEQKKDNAKTFFLLYISIMIQSSVDFVCILPELTC
jgi:hypothetical protein